MKIRIIFLFAFLLPLGARAELHNVAALSTSVVSTIAIFGPQVSLATITNTGTGTVNICTDGGTTVTGGTDPTTGSPGTGQPLLPNQTIVIYNAFMRNVAIRGIMASGTTTLNISTNGVTGTSTFPTN